MHACVYGCFGVGVFERYLLLGMYVLKNESLLLLFLLLRLLYNIVCLKRELK